jgi:hypothetical protein
MSTSNLSDHAPPEVDTLNTLLRCQLAAVESYDRALHRFEDSHILSDLQTIREEHAQAQNLLREKVVELGGEPAAPTGPWGACAAALSEESNDLGPATALAALRQGEEHSLNEFEDTLRHDDLNGDFKNLIRSKLLPTGRKHVAELNRLMGGSS